jgi:DNA-binding NtrC family response regulator
MSASAQAKVLRALQSGEIMRVGGERSIARGRAHRGGHQQGPRGRRGGGALPRGPLLPPQRGALRAPRCASAARTREVREAVERDFILKKLEETGWNVTRTADLLGIERTNLHKKLKQLGLRKETGFAVS